MTVHKPLTKFHFATPDDNSQSGPQLAPRLLIAGGGTGGHLFPGIALAQAFQTLFPEGQVLFVVRGNTFETTTLQRYGFEYTTLDVAGIKGVSILKKLRAVSRLLPALIASVNILRQFKPQRVIGVGGYVGGPLMLGAWLMGMPVFLQEQNVRAGITNRILLPLAKRMYVAFGYQGSGYFTDRILALGNPLRREMWATPEGQRSEKSRGQGAGCRGRRSEVGGRRCEGQSERRKGQGARNYVQGVSSKDQKPFTILVLGGSQGAHAVNQGVGAAMPFLKEITRLAIIHQTGIQDEQWVREHYQQNGIQATVAPFFNDLPDRYPAADLLICRAGALTIAEITALGKAAILIPFPYAADNHQELNARALEKEGAAMVLLEKDLTPQGLAAHIQFYHDNPHHLQAMARQARHLGRPKAALDIIRDCFHTQT